MEIIDAPRACSVAKLFHCLLYEVLTASVVSGAEVERLCDDLADYMRKVGETELPQEECIRIVALVWNRGVELTLSRKKREGDKIKRAGRRIAPFAKNYSLFFADKMLEGN